MGGEEAREGLTIPRFSEDYLFGKPERAGKGSTRNQQAVREPEVQFVLDRETRPGAAAARFRRRAGRRALALRVQALSGSQKDVSRMVKIEIRFVTSFACRVVTGAVVELVHASLVTPEHGFESGTRRESEWLSKSRSVSGAIGVGSLSSRARGGRARRSHRPVLLPRCACISSWWANPHGPRCRSAGRVAAHGHCNGRRSQS